MPVIASGGAGRLGDIKAVITEGRADAVALASILHYQFIKENSYQSSEFKTEGNTEFLRKGITFSKFEGVTLSDIKNYLVKSGIGCRVQTEVAYA